LFQLHVQTFAPAAVGVAGPELYKELVMSSNLPALLLHHMRCSTEEQVGGFGWMGCWGQQRVNVAQKG
jgi:hypothetical protein